MNHSHLGTVVFALWLGSQALAEVRPGRGPLVGYVDRGLIWAATDAEPATNSCTIFRGRLDGDSKPIASYFYAVKDLEHLFCWRIGHDIYWQGTGHLNRNNRIHRVPFRDLDLFESRDSATRTEKIAMRYPEDKDLGQLHLRPYPALYLSAELEDTAVGAYTTDAYYDFVPIGSNSLTLLMLHKKSIRLVRGEFSEAPKDKRAWHWWEYKWDKEPREIISANFHVPFIVYPAKDTYYFFTQFCECYGLRWNWKGYRQTVSLWSKEDQPIARLITDTATGKTFAFTLPLERKDGTKAKPGYFELSAKPELIEYDPAKIMKNDFEYPYKQIRECVDVLLSDRKIDPEKHKVPAKK